MKVVVFAFMFLSSSVSAEIYKWVDENGRVHFGDSPAQGTGAQKVEVDVISYEYVTVEGIDFYEPPEKKKKPGQVEMYSTSWCGYCAKARKYFRANNVSFVEYDIEKDKAAEQRFKKLGGRGVPVIVVGKQKMNGFNPQRFESIYN